MTQKITKPRKITKHMAIGDVASRYPETFEVFVRFGLHCIGCHVAAFETIEQGALSHGIDVDELVRELNEAVENKAKESS